MILYHGTDINSAQNIFNNKQIYVYFGKKYCDFGPGFYMTDNKDEAINWSKKKARLMKRSPAVITLDFDYSSAEPFIEKFEQDLRWGQFVINNRTGLEYIALMANKENNLDRKYHITCGKIADKDVTRLAPILKSEKKPLTSLTGLVGKKTETQYVLHTTFATTFVKIISYCKY